MARGHVSETLKVRDSSGFLRALAGATVTVRQVGTLLPLGESLYVDALSSAARANPLTTGSDGLVDFYLDTAPRVDLYIVAAGYGPITVTVEANPDTNYATAVELSTHAAATTGVHGVGASTVESAAGAQAKVAAHAALPDEHHAKLHAHNGLDGSGAVDYSNLTGKPTTFTPSAHTHAETDVTNLTTDLAGKAAAVHGHAESDITNLTTDLANKSDVGHTHTQAQSHNSPDTDTATTALHHTLGASANQAAAGNHTHNSAQAASAVGVTSGPTTTSPTTVDIPEMSVTLTTTGGNLLATGMIVLTHGTNATAFLILDLDGSGVSTSFYVSNVNGLYTVIHRWSGVAAGSHTVKLRWAVSTGTLTAVTTMREIMVEEVR